MLKNYLKVAIRSIKKNKLYAGLNILGLSVGLASFFIIYLFIQNELAYDQFHEKKDRVYRIIDSDTIGDVVEKSGSLTGALAPLVAENIPEIEAFSRVMFRSLKLRLVGEEAPLELSEGIWVDQGFLQIFDLDFIKGDVNNTVDAPISILLSESKALEYFGDTEVLGESIGDGKTDYLVSGVFTDLPNTSSIKGDFILLIKDVTAFRGHTWWHANLNAQSYFLLKGGAEISEVEGKINKVYAQNRDLAGNKFSLQVLSDVHFSIDIDGPVTEKTDRQYILIFTLVAVFILACAVFNYISLSLSQSIERAKEVGVRKVIGAKRSSLYFQFIIESVFHVLISYVLAIVLVEILIPQLELIVERDLDISIFNQPLLMAKGAFFSLLIGIVSASYPAFLSTRMKVVSIFKGGQKSNSAKRIINTVSVFQIVVFMVLICVGVTTNRQMHFMSNENLGFDQEQQLVIDWVGSNIADVFKNDVLSLSGVVSASHARNVPTKWEGWTDFKEVSGRFHLFDVDEDYLETMGMTLLEGRNFRPDETDSSNVIMINEAAAKKVSPEGSALGKTLPFTSSLYSKGDKRIIGIVNDFHYVSKREVIEPALFHPLKYHKMLVVKLSGQNLEATVESIKSSFYKLSNKAEMDYYFLDDEVQSQYKQENVMIQMINTFMIIAALVAFIGLFGLAGYSVKRRIKEVGIRKVLGAGFMAIQSNLNRPNLGRVMLAVVIGIPLIVYWMESWLNTFAYRIDIPYPLIFLAILTATVILLLVASFHSVRVFLINPVDILKDE